jgi:AbrB family looped-hinge helix DNA binding protein
MFLSVTSKRQVTFPAQVLAALGARPGDRLELLPSADGYLLRTKRVDASRLAPLRGRLQGVKPFDIELFRQERHAADLRD